MIQDLIGKLASIVGEMIIYNRESKRKLFYDFIDPAFSFFEEIHEEYLISFKKYRKLILSSKCPLTEDSPIFGIIEEDSLFSKNTRSRINGMTNVLSDDDNLNNFIYSINFYLLLVGRGRTIDELNSNAIRKDLIGNLKMIFALNMNSDKYVWRRIMFRLSISYNELLNETEVGQVCRNFNIDVIDSLKIEKLKAHLAIYSLDKCIEGMQDRYAIVNDEYNKLKKNLL